MTAGPTSRRRERYALAAILVVALVLRLGAIGASPGYVPTADAADYDRHAITLATAGTYPPTQLAEPGGASALRAPGYPYLLAGVYKVTGERWTAGRIAGALLGTLTVGLVFLLGRALWDARIGRLAAGLAAVLPPFALASMSLLSETLFVPLMLGAILCVLRLREGGEPTRWAALAGLVCAAAVLTRTNGILLAPVLAAGAWRAYPATRRRWVAPVVLLAVVAVALVPWSVRNSAAFDAFVPMGTQSGIALAGTFNAEAARHNGFYGVWRVPDAVREHAPLFHRTGITEEEIEGELRGDALRFAADHPGYVAAVTAIGLARMFDLGPGHAFVSDQAFAEQGLSFEQRQQTRVTGFLLLALAIVGAVILTRRRAWGPVFVWSAPLALGLSLAATVGTPRYRIVLDPFLALLAAYAVVATRDAWRVRRGRRPA